MIRLLNIVLALLIAGVLPAQAQDCCDPVAASQCHHHKAPAPQLPCQPTLSACPDNACFMGRDDSAVPVAGLQQELVAVAAPAPFVRAIAPVCTALADAGAQYRPLVAEKLFLRYRVIVI